MDFLCQIQGHFQNLENEFVIFHEFQDVGTLNHKLIMKAQPRTLHCQIHYQEIIVIILCSKTVQYELHNSYFIYSVISLVMGEHPEGSGE